MIRDDSDAAPPPDVADDEYEWCHVEGYPHGAK